MSASATLGCAVLAACSFPADYGGTRFRCDVGGGANECPAGYTCVAGFCEAGAPMIDGGGGGGGGGDAGDPADANGPPDAGVAACTRVSAFSDNFESGAAWDTFEAPGCQTSFEIGRIRLNSSTGLAAACGARSTELYHLDERTWIEAVGPGQGSPRPEFGITIGEETLVFRRDQNGLAFVVRDLAGNESTLDDLPFDPFDHAFWAFSPDEAGEIAWETSQDAQEWTVQVKFAPKSAPSEECVRYLIAITGTPVQLPPIISFDNLNLPGGPGG